jgi:hypothetical protein
MGEMLPTKKPFIKVNCEVIEPCEIDKIVVWINQELRIYFKDGEVLDAKII